MKDPDILSVTTAATGLLTAAFTGYPAYTRWQDRRDRHLFEWKIQCVGAEGVIEMHCGISNFSDSTLDLESVEISGPVLDVRQRRDGKAAKKHDSWAANRSSISCEIPSGKRGEFTVLVYPDLPSTISKAESASSRLRLVVARLLSRSVGWRIGVGAKFRVSINARKRSASMRRKRFIAIIRLNAATAQQMHAKVNDTSIGGQIISRPPS